MQEMIRHLGTYGYAAVFAAMLLTGIGLPLPGELTLGFTGYLVFCGQLELLPAISASAFGDLLGAVIGYKIGFLGRTKVINRRFRFLIPADSNFSRTERWLTTYGVLAVVLGRILPVIRGVIPIPAGFAQMNGKIYIFGISVSSIIWCGALIYLGIGLGYNWQLIAGFGNTLALAVGGGFAVGLLLWYFSYLRKKLK